MNGYWKIYLGLKLKSEISEIQELTASFHIEREVVAGCEWVYRYKQDMNKRY